MGVMNGTVGASCVYIPQWHEMHQDQLAATIANIFIAVVGVLSLLYYGVHSYMSTCGWEEVYVCTVELVKVCLEIFLEYCVPVTFYETNGSFIIWVRYAEWLLTCPVILIHLSNLTGLADDYNKRTMELLVSDIGTIVMGVTAAIATGYVKLAFFLLGCCYGCLTFRLAAQIHLEAFYSMPRGKCRRLVKWMALVFFSSWLGFPILFVLGKEGFFGVLSHWGSVVGHCIVDLLSKNVWGLLGHHLRIHVQEHIVMHGIVRVRKVHRVLGFFELEVDSFVEDENTEGAVRSSMAGVAQRKDMQRVRSALAARGHTCCDVDLPASGMSAPGAAQPAKIRGPSLPGLQGVADADDDIEYIMPAQFIMGNPRWNSSLAGGVRRVHPSAANSSVAGGGHGQHSRGASLDWPDRAPGNAWGQSDAVPAAAGAGATAEERQGADAAAAVAVRAKANMDAPKME